MQELEDLTFGLQESYHALEGITLNQEQYFQVLFQEACRRNLIDSETVERIQHELLELMSKEVERYTNDESSSIPVEQAQNLLQSITYCIGSYLKTIRGRREQLNIIIDQPITKLFGEGMSVVEKRVASARLLLQCIQEERLRINNIAYQDTILTGLPKFFHDYNIEYGAHQTPADIDYPTYITLTDLIGVEYLEEYLRMVHIENSFLLCFSAKNINQLLLGFDRQAEHMLINIFELVIINSIGCQLLGKDLKGLDITAQENVWLQERLKDKSKEELDQLLSEAFLEAAEALGVDQACITHARLRLSDIAARLYHQLELKTLSHFFVSFEDGWTKEYEILEEGEIMENDKLCRLIERIEKVSTIKAKVQLLLNEVRSTTDLIELLEECFYEGDYAEVFSLFERKELTMLEKRILQEAGGIPAEDFEPEEEWQKILWNYLHR